MGGWSLPTRNIEMLPKSLKNITRILCHLKHCEKTRKSWKHIGEKTPGLSILWLFWRRSEALGQEETGFHWTFIMERHAPYCCTHLALFQELNVTVQPTQADHKHGCTILICECRSPARFQQPVRSQEGSVLSHIPTPRESLLLWSLSGNHQSHPMDYTAGSLHLMDSFMDICDKWIWSSHSQKASQGGTHPSAT